jgi:hypothetical protein
LITNGLRTMGRLIELYPQLKNTIAASVASQASPSAFKN